MKPYQETACQTALPISPVDEAFSEIEIALKCLSEAVERVASKTSAVRYPLPCGNGNDKIAGVPSASRLVDRLYDIKADICHQADAINNLSDEIQL